MEKSIIPEAARWGDQHGRNITPQNWTSMRDRILTTYLPQRTAIVLGQFRTAGLYPNVDAPVFYVNGNYQHGGHVAASDSFSMKTGSGTVYYTLDGSDPRLVGPDRSDGRWLLDPRGGERPQASTRPNGSRGRRLARQSALR